MSAILKSPFVWLLRREYWEQRRSMLWAQGIAAGVLVILTVLGIILAESVGMHLDGDARIVSGSDVARALQNAFNHDSDAVARGLVGMMWSFGVIAAITLSFTLFFYLLGALYDDRKDRSILFWKSLPVSDTATVVSKIVTAVLVMPLIAVAVVLAGYLAQQLIASAWFAAHGLNPFTMIWSHASPFVAWLYMLATLPVNAVWALPTIGWLLFWSAAARSKPFLWATFIPIIAGVLNSWIGLLGLPHISAEFFWGQLVGRALLSTVPGSWATVAGGSLANFDGGFRGASGLDIGAASYGAMYRTFLTPEMWIGAAIGIALIAAAIWFRRWRDEA